MRFYAYCLSDEAEAAQLDSLRGIAGASVRLISYESISVVASEFHEESVSVTRENVLVHERVVQAVFVLKTVLPFRFGAVVDESRLRSYVESNRELLKAQLLRVRGCVEMSVKIVCGEEAREGNSDILAPHEENLSMTGTAFLERKRREIAGDERTKERADEISAWLVGRLGDAVRESLMAVRPSDTPLFSVAHLIERARLDEYNRRLKSAVVERPELHFLTSGPWPPYSFSDINS